MTLVSRNTSRHVSRGPLRCEELHFATLHLTDTCVIPAEFIWALPRFCKLLGTGYLSGNGRLLIDDVHAFGPVVF